MKTLEIEEKLALKELVDTFSILADKKDVAAQVLLFTENSVVQTYINGEKVTDLTGRAQIGDVFTSFLAGFETVYHINGQQTVTINGDTATGISYCQVVLIRDEDGKKIMTTHGVNYQDEYVRENERWLISNRVSTFVWTDNRELGK